MCHIQHTIPGTLAGDAQASFSSPGLIEEFYVDETAV